MTHHMIKHHNNNNNNINNEPRGQGLTLAHGQAPGKWCGNDDINII
jgi:hypothetical protein